MFDPNYSSREEFMKTVRGIDPLTRQAASTANTSSEVSSEVVNPEKENNNMKEFMSNFRKGFKVGLKYRWRNGGWLQWILILFAIPFGILMRRRWKAADKSEKKLLIASGVLYEVFNLALGLFVQKKVTNELETAIEDGTLYDELGLDDEE